jgi:hypothetical protein
MAEKRIAAFTPQQRNEIMAVIKDYMARVGLSARREGVQTFNQPTPIYVKNTSSSEAPAWACMQVTGTEEFAGQNYITVSQPSDVTGSAGFYLFNGIQPIASGRYGIGHDGPLLRMLTDGSSISCGDRWAPVVSQWYVEPDVDGIVSAVGADDIGTNVMRAFLLLQSPQKPDIDLRVSGLNFQINYNMGDGWETWATGEECA